MTEVTEAALPTPSSGEELYEIARNAPGGESHLFGLTYDRRSLPVAAYPATNEDGGDVLVKVTRLPAMFYEISCPAKRIYLGTGSGAHQLVHDIAVALANGMLGLRDVAEEG